MNIREFVKDSLEKFAAKLNDVFSKKEYEHVKVTVRGAQWNSNDECDESADVEGGKVYVESYHPGLGKVNKELSYDIPASGIVEFDILKGTHYSVYSKVEGLGASMRCVYVAGKDNRSIPLWNMSLGVWKAAQGAIYNEDTDSYRVVPIFVPNGDADLSDYYWDTEGSEYVEEYFAEGVLVSTADSSFVLAPNSKADETLVWSNQSYGREVPYLECYESQSAVDKDYSGNLNTDKIVSSLTDAPAAYFAIKNTMYGRQNYLPSIGEHHAIDLNKSAINSLISDWGDSDIPSIDQNWYWSSNQYSADISWYWSYDDTYWYSNTKGGNYYCRSVSAFTYEY